MIGDMAYGAWCLVQSPLIWAPLLTALLVWFFMAGVRIGEMRAEDRQKR